MVGKLNEISHRKTLREVFKHFKEINNDSQCAINIEEFKKISKRIPILKDQSEASLIETFKQIDVDSSGDLTISEFHTFYAGLQLRKLPKELQPYPDKDLEELKGFAFLRKYLWITLGTHETSLGKIFGPAMFLLILVSVVSYCLATIPSLKYWPGWSLLDAVTSIIFTAEFALRLLTTGQKIQFLIEPFNIIDFCSFIPFYIELALMEADVTDTGGISYLRVLRVCRLMKVIRISRYMSPYLEVFSETVILARHSFSMLMSLILFGTTVLGAIMYSAEEKEGTFDSIFEAMYWCVVTQTTVGYGDITVVTDLGRFIACLTAYAGIFNLTIMVNVVGSCFDEAYTRFLTKEEESFKQQLGIGMKSQVFRESIQESYSTMMKRRITNMPQASTKQPVKSMKQLMKKVPELVFIFADLETTWNILSCDSDDPVAKLMVEVRDRLNEVIEYVETSRGKIETLPLAVI